MTLSEHKPSNLDVNMHSPGFICFTAVLGYQYRPSFNLCPAVSSGAFTHQKDAFKGRGEGATSFSEGLGGSVGLNQL